MKKRVYIYTNEIPQSLDAAKRLSDALPKDLFEIAGEYEDGKIDLVACIGGDGTFLSCMHSLDLPSCDIIGINTGHLGFFQEISPDQIDDFIEAYISKRYVIQESTPVVAEMHAKKAFKRVLGVNEVCIRGPYAHVCHLSVCIDETFIQDFSGDGILVSTPVGSTAYNYSLGGAIISPELEVVQLTPIAPMSTNAYRCFRAGIILPADKAIKITPNSQSRNKDITISYDRSTEIVSGVEKIEISKCAQSIRLIRMTDYDYWSKLTSKLL